MTPIVPPTASVWNVSATVNGDQMTGTTSSIHQRHAIESLTCLRIVSVGRTLRCWSYALPDPEVVVSSVFQPTGPHRPGARTWPFKQNTGSNPWGRQLVFWSSATGVPESMAHCRGSKVLTIECHAVRKIKS